MMLNHYPRDLTGYGQTTPTNPWPDKARIAVQFVLNVEEGAENSILHGDQHSETFLSDIIGAQAFTERHMSMESLYEYGTRAGFWRIYRLFKHYDIPVTVFGVAMALQRNPAIVDAILAANWEIASHGYRWISYQGMPQALEREHIQQAMEIHKTVTGNYPQGWYTGRDSPHTRELILAHDSLVYDSDSYADDLPYWYQSTMTTRSKPHLIIPYTLDTNDMRFATPQGFHTARQFYRYLKDAFDILYAEGSGQYAEPAPKLLNIGLHCRIIGRPARLKALQDFIKYLVKFNDVWLCRRIDIATHWYQHFLPE